MPQSTLSSDVARVTADEFASILAERLPLAASLGLQVDSIKRERVIARAVYSDHLLRPGGTIAGPVMMGLADVAIYALVLANIGPVELAVTTQVSINFLNKPGQGDLLAEGRLLKLGKRLAVGDVVMYSEHGDPTHPVAQASATYSIPPPKYRSIKPL